MKKYLLFIVGYDGKTTKVEFDSYAEMSKKQRLMAKNKYVKETFSYSMQEATKK